MSPIGFGAFKIGRNVGIKYAHGYDLPSDSAVDRLLNTVLDSGINYIDTAPAYGISEERIGRAIAARRREFVLSTKVGETFDDGRSTYDFSERAVRTSIERSLERLRTDELDIVLIHSDGNDLQILNHTDVVPTLTALRDAGVIKAIGLSAKTVDGGRAALAWTDVLMVEYHLRDQSYGPVIAEAVDAGVGVVVKKGLASGEIDPVEAVPFVLGTPGVASLVIGGLDIDHIQANIRLAEAVSSARE
ncbi:MAG: aldo/keto reductase [Phycisphaerales bacterium]